MAGGYETPDIDQLDALITRIRKAEEDIREIGRPTGSQVANALQTLQDLVKGLIAQVNGIFSGYVQAGGNISAGGNVLVTGDVYTPHGRVTPVVTSYVAAYLDSVGRLGATPSARRFKRDRRAKEYSLEQIMLAQIVMYRLRALVGLMGQDAPFEVGVIAEQLVHAGLSEFVVFGADGRPFSVAYERLSLLALSGVQQLYSRLLDVEQRLEEAGI